jgi:hypothetical protein
MDIPNSRICMYYQAGGVPEVLLFLVSIAENLPNLDGIASAGGKTLGPQFASVVIECLTSSKSETRAAATSLLESAIVNGIIGTESLRKASERLKPAKQRTVAPLVAKFLAQTVPDSGQSEKRNAPTSEPSTAPPDTPEVNVSSLRNSNRPVAAPAAQRGSRAVSTKNSDSASKPQHKETARHPLAPRSASSRSSSTGIVWPEYPEEPQGGSLYGNLKKAWSQIISPSSVSVLFPPSGIKKQDEAQAGCELLVSALEADRSDGKAFVVDQLDLVMKWVTYAACSRETTVGLQSLLGLTKDLFSYLLELKHELSDSVALEIIPYLLEKASNAKVCFTRSWAVVVIRN